MKVQKSIIDNKTVTQVFLSKEESKNKELIKELKQENQNVVLFLSGNKNIAESLKYMLQFMKNKVEVN